MPTQVASRCCRAGCLDELTAYLGPRRPAKGRRRCAAEPMRRDRRLRPRLRRGPPRRRLRSRKSMLLCSLRRRDLLLQLRLLHGGGVGLRRRWRRAANACGPLLLQLRRCVLRRVLWRVLLPRLHGLLLRRLRLVRPLQHVRLHMLLRRHLRARLLRQHLRRQALRPRLLRRLRL